MDSQEFYVRTDSGISDSLSPLEQKVFALQLAISPNKLDPTLHFVEQVASSDCHCKPLFESDAPADLGNCPEAEKYTEDQRTKLERLNSEWGRFHCNDRRCHKPRVTFNEHAAVILEPPELAQPLKEDRRGGMYYMLDKLRFQHKIGAIEQ